MKLTKQCKEDFEKWLVGFGRGITRYPYKTFRELEPQMQYGVYVDFFDSVGLTIVIRTYVENTWRYDINQDQHRVMIKTRTEARKFAIEKANEIYNEL